MPSPKPYDTTINCGPDNPLTLINRGPIKVRVLHEDMKDPSSSWFVELRLGKRRQRTAFLQPYEPGLMIGEVLQMLGFEPEVTEEAMNMDERYD